MDQNVVQLFLDNGYLLSPELINKIDDEPDFLKLITEKVSSAKRPLVLNPDLLFAIKKSNSLMNINWLEFEKSKALLEKGRDGRLYQTFLDIFDYGTSGAKTQQMDNIISEIKRPEDGIAVEIEKNMHPSVVVTESYDNLEKKNEAKDFANHFRLRYNALRSILQNRKELANTVSISRLHNKNSSEHVSLIGIVSEKRETSNGNIILKIEDMTDSISVLVSKDKLEMFSVAKNIVEDEVVGFNGYTSSNKGMVFASNIFFPDVPVDHEFKKADEEIFAAFISDIHVGSKMFLQDDFMRFVKWINGKSGTREQLMIAENVRYLFITGDLVDGVGIYPGQEEELAIRDVKKQYELCALLLSGIRKDIKIIICPGNHDAVRSVEPQPPLDKRYAQPIWDLGQVMVSNPAWINIHSSEHFKGFDVLMYHGTSFNYYIDNVESLRHKKARDNPSQIMKFLLQKRHLSPVHGASLYVPHHEKDYMVIHKVPDFFIAGDLHRLDIAAYNNVTTINGSCFQAKTSFQEKTGNNPDPSKVPVVNLMTREVKVLKFGLDR